MSGASLASFFSSLTTLPRLSRISYSGTKVFRSTPIPLDGRSRTCPIDAFTTKSSPRYLLIVFALAGDSTITRDFLDAFLAIYSLDVCDRAIGRSLLNLHAFAGYSALPSLRLPQKGGHYGEAFEPCQGDVPHKQMIVRLWAGGFRVSANDGRYKAYA